jgi:hypothetical protein
MKSNGMQIGAAFLLGVRGFFFTVIMPDLWLLREVV